MTTETGADVETVLPDLTDVSFDELDPADGTVLAHALQRLTGSDDPVAQFQNVVAPE